MKPNPDPRDRWRDLCAHLHDEDGLTPAEYKRKKQARPGQQDRTTMRLCAQAGRAIRMALLADCHDTDLQALDVINVEPWPDARRLRVHVVCTSTEISPDVALQKLFAVSHLLRHAVAQSITRKKAPQLLFVVHPHDDQGGADDDR